MGAEGQSQGPRTPSKQKPVLGLEFFGFLCWRFALSDLFLLKAEQWVILLQCLTFRGPQAFTPFEVISFNPSSDVRTCLAEPPCTS